jgi:hypothetical protein
VKSAPNNSALNVNVSTLGFLIEPQQRTSGAITFTLFRTLSITMRVTMSSQFAQLILQEVCEKQFNFMLSANLYQLRTKAQNKCQILKTDTVVDSLDKFIYY